MTTPRRLEQSRSYPLGADDAFAAVLTAPLEQVFRRRYLALPPVREVRDQEGTWGTVGQTRTIVLADGGTLHEELTSVAPGREFGYQISRVTGPMKALVTSLEGQWDFDAVDTGTRVTWSWTVLPATAVAARAMPVFARLWQGYARQALEEIEGLAVGR